MHYALVSKSIGSIMAKNDFNSILEDEVFYGMKVELLDNFKDWYLVKTHYHYKGFMHKSELVADNDIINEFESKKTLMITNAFADILSIPSVKGSILISLTRGAQVAKISNADDNGWIKVQLIDGTIGFIKEKFVNKCIDSLSFDTSINFNKDLNPGKRIQSYLNQYLKINEDTFRKNIVKTALSYLGSPYRWGGKSPLGIDCSGLTSISYMLNGLIIYRDSSLKDSFPVYEIDIKSIKKADLLLTNGHIMLYIGNNNYIHSTAKNRSDGVVINSLNPIHKNYRTDLASSILKVVSVF